MKTIIAAASAALLLAGPALAAPGDELAGNSLQVRFANSPLRSVLHFWRDGRVLVTTMHGDRPMREDGRWSVRAGRVCFNWRRSPDECWGYPGGLQPNRPVRVMRLDRPVQATATLVTGHRVGPPPSLRR